MNFSIDAVWAALRTVCPWAFIGGSILFQIPPSPQLLDESGFRLFFAIRTVTLAIGLGLWYIVQRLLRKNQREGWIVWIWLGTGATALLLSFLYYLSTYGAEHHFYLLLLLFALDSFVVGFIMTGAVPLLQAPFRRS
jgi:predicted permease